MSKSCLNFFLTTTQSEILKAKRVGGRGKKRSPRWSSSNFRQCQRSVDGFIFPPSYWFPSLKVEHLHHPHSHPHSRPPVSVSLLSSLWGLAPELVVEKLLYPRTTFGPRLGLVTGKRSPGQRRGLELVLRGYHCKAILSAPFLSTAWSPWSVAKRPACCLQDPRWRRLP